MISEILTGLIVFCLSLLIEHYLLPALKGLRERVSDVSGHWRIYFPGIADMTPGGTMNIKQWGVKIKATCTLITNEKGVSTHRFFHYKGFIHSGQIVLSFKEEKREDFIVGAMVLKLTGDVNAMKGKTLFWHHSADEFVINDFVLQR